MIAKGEGLVGIDRPPLRSRPVLARMVDPV